MRAARVIGTGWTQPGGPHAEIVALWAARLIDRIWASGAPRLVGGGAAPGPIVDPGVALMADAQPLRLVSIMQLDDDLLLIAAPRQGCPHHHIPPIDEIEERRAMFTGIIEEIGSVRATTLDAALGKAITIGCRTVMGDARLGDSIAVNGICLTVTALSADSFSVGISPETERRTNLGLLRVGDPVNLERSLAFGERLGGHYVQGHVDGTGEIIRVVPDGDSLRVTIRPPQPLMPYIVEKGYIAVDGTSLTVAERSPADFTIALIAYTQGAVIMGRQQPGARVNLEVDIMAKYVESISQQYLATRA